MANTFTAARARNIGTSAATVYTAPVSTTSICIELDVCNTTNGGVTCDAFIVSGGNNYYIVKNAPVPVGGSLQIISGQKIVLSNGDILKVVSSVASSLDAVGSVLEGV
jgi:hypothetical protein